MSEDADTDADSNPAATAEGTSLAELFASDPLDLSAADRQTIIDKFRQERHRFLQQEQEKSAGKASKKKTSAKAAQDLNIDLDDIEL